MSIQENINFTGNFSSKDETDQSSFEDKVKSAKEILEKLINPDITLSESVNIYKDGMKELESAQKLLDEAKLEFQEYTQE